MQRSAATYTLSVLLFWKASNISSSKPHALCQSERSQLPRGEESIMELEQVESLMGKPEQELLLQWYDEELKQTVGSSADDLVGVVGDVRRAFLNWCQQIGLNDLLCIQWGYRAKKKILLPAHLALAIG